MKVFLCSALLAGCTSTSIPSKEPQKESSSQLPALTPKYKNGDCLMLVDPLNSRKPTRHRMRVEKVDIKAKRYWYRWLLDDNRWDSGLSTTVGEFLVLEKITEKVDDCPKVGPQNDDKNYISNKAY